MHFILFYLVLFLFLDQSLVSTVTWIVVTCSHFHNFFHFYDHPFHCWLLTYGYNHFHFLQNLSIGKFISSWRCFCDLILHGSIHIESWFNLSICNNDFTVSLKLCCPLQLFVTVMSRKFSNFDLSSLEMKLTMKVM